MTADGPYVGEKYDGNGCAYALRPGDPPCAAPVTVHVVVFAAEWGIVGLPACPDHAGRARAAGNFIDQHPFTGQCRVGCWSNEGAL